MFANNLTQNGWMAVAFQGQACKQIENEGGACMASTPVTECSWVNQNNLMGSLSWNDAQPKNVRIANVDGLMKAANFTTLIATQIGSMTYCKVSQLVSQAPLTGVADMDKVFQANPALNYTILNAVGPGNGTVLAIHTSTNLSPTRIPIVFANSNETTVASTPETTTPVTAAITEVR
ncbi:unnamed protein product, partial [Mesorhabditis spiculigera]